MASAFDIAAVRLAFPVTGHMLYFDTAFQAPLPLPVKTAIEQFLAESHLSGGPKSLWLDRVAKVRAKLASVIGAEADEIAFTKNTSEGLNAAAQALPLQPGDEVLLVHGDHPNNAYAFLNLRAKGVVCRFIDVTGERVDAQTIAPHLSARTRVVSLSHVTFHSGHRYDIASIGGLCADRGVRLVVDAMQSIGMMPIDVKAMNVSMLAFGCHKGLMVPQGLGALYVSRSLDDLAPAYLATAGLADPPPDLIARPDDIALRPAAGRFELGNYNLLGIYGLDASLDFLGRLGWSAITDHVLTLGDHLISHLDTLGIGLVGPRSRADRSHIHVLSLPAESWIPFLAENNVRASPERDGVRISFAPFNTTEEIDRLAAILRRGVGKLGHSSYRRAASM